MRFILFTKKGPAQGAKRGTWHTCAAPESCLAIATALRLCQLRGAAGADQPTKGDGSTPERQTAGAVVTTRTARTAFPKAPKIDANWFGSDPVTRGRIMIPAQAKGGAPGGAVRIGGSLHIFISGLRDWGKQHANETCR